MQHDYAEFKKKYDVVFDNHGYVKPCGRQACIELITICENISSIPKVDFGNKKTGIMNVEAIKSLAADIL